VPVKSTDGEETRTSPSTHRRDRPALRRRPGQVLIIVGVLVLAGIGGVVGAAVSGSGKGQPSASSSAAPPSSTQPSSSASPKTPALGANLAQLPINTELTGAAAQSWAKATLSALGAPATAANLKTMVDWFANEGAPHDLNNPLNLQTPEGGSTVSTASGAPAEARIQAYPSPADFVAAFPVEMSKESYPAMLAGLKSGQGLEGDNSSELRNELSIYSGGGYDTIPAAYNMR
jgi:hypothetical protein